MKFFKSNLLFLKGYFAIFASLTLLSLVAVTPVQAQEDEFIEGGHYEVLPEVLPIQTGDKIEVVEMFWYRCPHCYRLEPYMIDWLENKKPENAEFVPMPAVLNDNWAYHARAYYVFEALGMDEVLHAKFFDAIHKERKPFNSAEQLADWVAVNGGDRNAVLDTWDSFAVENKIKFASIMSRKYGISGVPAVIVDGRYRTSVSLAGSHEQLIKLINFLVKKAAEARTTTG